MTFYRSGRPSSPKLIACRRGRSGKPGRPFLFYVCMLAGLMDETLYDGLAHEAAFYVPTAGMVRFVLSPAGASAYVRSRNGSLARVQSRDRLFLSAGEHILILYDPELAAHVSIVLMRE